MSDCTQIVKTDHQRHLEHLHQEAEIKLARDPMRRLRWVTTQKAAVVFITLLGITILACAAYFVGSFLVHWSNYWLFHASY